MSKCFLPETYCMAMPCKKTNKTLDFLDYLSRYFVDGDQEKMKLVMYLSSTEKVNNCLDRWGGQ